MRAALAMLCLLTALEAAAATDRLHALASELRCPVCQNQTLADSNADLASDLKAEIHRQIEQGRSDEEIRRFMVTRYGDFVLYQPPVRADTGLLWAAPFALLAAGAAAFALRLARSQRCDQDPKAQA